MSNGYLSGSDALDIARMSGIQLCRVPCKIGDPPDTSWQTAEEAIADGDDPINYFLDLDHISSDDAGKAILALTGAFRAFVDADRADRVGMIHALLEGHA